LTESVRRRKPGWWAIPSQNIEPTCNFLLYVIGERFLAPWSDQPVASDRCFHRLFVPYSQVASLAVSINSTLTFLLMSLFGRGNLGQGAQKNETSDAKKLLVLHPDTHGLAKEANTVLLNFGSRKVLPVIKELGSPDRHKLDELIFDALQLTQDERDDLYEAVINLVGARLGKAESLKPRTLRKRMKAADKTRGIWADLPDDVFDEEPEG